MQSQRIVDAVAEKTDRSPVATQQDDQPRLLFGRDAGEDGVVSRGVREIVVAERLELRAGDGALGRQTKVGANLFGNPRVVPGGDLQLDAKSGQVCQGLAYVGLGFVGENQKAGQHQSAFVGGGNPSQLGSGFCGHGHHSASRGEQSLKGLVRDVRRQLASAQYLLGCALDDEHALAVVINQHRRRPALMVERQHRDALHGAADQLLRLLGLPQRGVERVGADTTRLRPHIGGQQPKTPYRVAVRTGRIDGVDQADPAFSQSAGLIGDQGIDVTEIFNAYQPLDALVTFGVDDIAGLSYLIGVARCPRCHASGPLARQGPRRTRPPTR
jgi:hypothetical protein